MSRPAKLYSLFSPVFLTGARTAIEAVFDEIETLRQANCAGHAQKTALTSSQSEGGKMAEIWGEKW